ncbi:MAG: hypothetical protein WDO24_30880 [Pseudomonadota bacterium]
MRHPQGRAERGEEQLRRLAQPERAIGGDDRPLVAQDHQPGIGADQEAGPEAHADDQEQDGRDGIVAARHDVSQRIAQQQAEHGDDQRGPKGIEHHAGIERGREDAAIVGQADRRIGDAEHEHIADRQDEQQDEEAGGGGEQQPRPSQPYPAAARARAMRQPLRR